MYFRKVADNYYPLEQYATILTFLTPILFESILKVNFFDAASQPNKEWKPKSSKTSSLNGPGVIGTPAKSVSNLPDNSKGLDIDEAQVQEKLSRVNNFENQNVIIAEHIRVTESDRCRLTFGSFGTEFDSFGNVVSESHAVENAENASAR